MNVYDGNRVHLQHFRDHSPEGAFRTRLGNPNLNALWDGPPQNIDRRIHIAIEHAPALAFMNANRQRLPNDLPAARTFLAGVLCVYQMNQTASTFSLACQDLDELAPASIRDTPRHPVVLEHPHDVQAFRSDDAVSVDQRTRNFVVHVAPRLTHLPMQRSDSLLDLLPAIAAAVAAIQSALAAPQFWQGPLQGSAVAKFFSVTGCDKRLQPDVDANATGMRHRLHVRCFNKEKGKPLSAIADNVESLDFCRRGDFAMQSHADSPNVLETKLVATYREPIAAPVDSRVSELIKPVRRLKSRMPRRLSLLNAAEESRMSFVELAECLPCRTGVNRGKEWVAAADSSEPSRLFVARPSNSFRFPAEHRSIERAVVKTAMRLQRPLQFTALAGVGKQTVFERPVHMSILTKTTAER